MKDFPFGLAVVFALLLHSLIGLALRHNFLIAAAPLPPGNQPVNVRIVDVPKGGPTLKEPPPTRNLSDANRKAGPLQKTLEPRAIRPPAEIQQRAAGTPAPRMQRPNARSPAPQQRSVNNAPPLPEIQSTVPPNDSAQAQIRAGEQVNQQKLQKSLQNLDRYIPSGDSSTGQGGQNGKDAGGDALQGDPGSGVFFDTRGFDLGPWATRVVAIVKRNWLIPVAADLGVKGVVSVAFEVERNGTIQNIRIVSSSKVSSFDQAAVNALKTSTPFPPLPSEFPRQVLPGVFRFYYNIPVPN